MHTLNPTSAAAISLFVIAALHMSSCADTEDPEVGAEEPFVNHDVTEDFEVAADDGKSDQVSARFNQHFILSDDFFLDAGDVDGNSVQLFLEQTPYGKRSWLADETIDGQRAADVIVRESQETGINPIVILARMQAEQGLISKTVRPSQSKIDKAFGCGCPDGGSCASRFLGFGNQIECASSTMLNLYQASVNGNGQWQRGKTKQSLDRYSVRPQNHATAAMYAYTPWVLPRQGGNWLVWNITKKYLNYFVSEDLYDVPEPSWVGTPCADADSCHFTADGNPGFCFEYATHGFCSVPCEGYCPDQAGEAQTFCVSLGSDYGLCVSKSASQNNYCADIPGTVATDADRFIGSSSARASTAKVCIPE